MLTAIIDTVQFDRFTVSCETFYAAQLLARAVASGSLYRAVRVYDGTRLIIQAYAEEGGQLR